MSAAVKAGAPTTRPMVRVPMTESSTVIGTTTGPARAGRSVVSVAPVVSKGVDVSATRPTGPLRMCTIRPTRPPAITPMMAFTWSQPGATTRASVPKSAAAVSRARRTMKSSR